MRSVTPLRRSPGTGKRDSERAVIFNPLILTCSENPCLRTASSRPGCPAWSLTGDRTCPPQRSPSLTRSRPRPRPPHRIPVHARTCPHCTSSAHPLPFPSPSLSLFPFPNVQVLRPHSHPPRDRSHFPRSFHICPLWLLTEKDPERRHRASGCGSCGFPSPPRAGVAWSTRTGGVVVLRRLGTAATLLPNWVPC